jgi:hypothetical protein
MTTIFVFGSNTEGRHGKGTALFAVKNFGAKYGVPSGLQRSSYAIITKDLKFGKRSISLDYIEKQIGDLHRFTCKRLNMLFVITPIGAGLAGYTIEEIKRLFTKYKWPDTVFFHSKFL